MTPEQQAREQIDQQLTLAGWVIQDYRAINLGAAGGVAVREYPTDSGPADYVLHVDRQPVGVIEAKKAGTLLSPVEEQTGRYAASGLKWQRNTPTIRFLYETTGTETFFTDALDPMPRAREVFGFHRPEGLREWLRQPDTLRARLLRLPPLATEALRECQITAVRNLETSFGKNRPRALVQMATGAGKTFTAITAVYRLLRYAGAKRVLFLVDTRNLGEQAEQEFQAYGPPDDARRFPELYGVQRLRSGFVDPHAQVCISTIQRMYSVLRGEELDESAEDTSLNELNLKPGAPREVAYNGQVPPETFDFIVIDECHRSIYNVWQQVLDYFDAFLVGLTATPDKRTFGFFNENVVSEYSYERAVADGVNVPYDVYVIETEVTRRGGELRAQEYIEHRSRQTRARRWAQLDEDVTYGGKQLDRDVVNPSQIRTVVREFGRALREEIFPNRVNGRGEYEVPKTLIFAKTDAHAEDIIRVVREEFGEGNAFCKKVTYGNHEEKAAAVLQQFRNEYYPRVAVTVDMIATGTDVKAIECLLFMRDVRSRSYFEQMKGRGTRTLGYDDLKQRSQTARSAKTHFVIVDAVGVCQSLKTDSRPLERLPTVSLQDLMMRVAVGGDRTEDTLLSLANRLTRLEKQLTPPERARFGEVSGGLTLNALVRGLLDVDNPDAYESMGVGSTEDGSVGEGSMEDAAARKLARERLAAEATRPFDRPEVREWLETTRRQYDVLIDHVNLDTTRFAGWDAQAAEQAQALTAEFRGYLDAHREEVAALRIFYGQPWRRRELTYRMVGELADKLRADRPTLAPTRIWQAYEALDGVKAAAPRTELLAVVALVRRALGIDAQLTPYEQVVNRNFQGWVFGKQAGALKFSDEQMAWLRMMRDLAATSVQVDAEAFELSPFAERGGLGKAWSLFGDETPTLLTELNEALAA